MNARGTSQIILLESGFEPEFGKKKRFPKLRSSL